MGQKDIFDWLKTQRLAGNDRYYSISEIYQAFGLWRPDGFTPAKKSVWNSISKLRAFGYLDVKGPRVGRSQWPAYVRLKKKYCNGEKII